MTVHSFRTRFYYIFSILSFNSPLNNYRRLMTIIDGSQSVHRSSRRSAAIDLREPRRTSSHYVVLYILRFRTSPFMSSSNVYFSNFDSNVYTFLFGSSELSITIVNINFPVYHVFFMFLCFSKKLNKSKHTYFIEIRL